jgi:predicted nucleotide-binding protein
MASDESSGGSRKYRNYPQHSLEEALVVAQKIQDEMGGKPFKRLLLADALGIKPSSSNYKALLSSSLKYGLTEGTEKASDITLTKLGADATQTTDSSKRITALRKAAMTPPVFERFYNDYTDKKMPSPEMIGKILASEYSVPDAHTEECARYLQENGRFTKLVRDIGGSPHVLLDAEPVAPEEETEADEESGEDADHAVTPDDDTAVDASGDGATPPPTPPSEPKRQQPIFLAHGKKTGPLKKLQEILTSFQIPHKVAVQEANLGRPIPQKVKGTMSECGSAILIFTRDEKFTDKDGNEVWRPSENVVYELGAASYAYEDRVVIFKESGIDFPANFQSIGYIEFEESNIEAKTADLLKELIGFGLVKVTTA